MSRLVALASLVLVVAFAACGGAKATPTPRPTPTPLPTPTPTPTFLGKTVNKMNTLRAFHFSGTNSSQDVPEPIEIEGDMILPDRISITLTGTLVAGFEKQQVAGIMIGKESYFTNAGPDKWFQMDRAQNPLGGFDPMVWARVVLGKAKDVESQPNELLNGVEMYVFIGHLNPQDVALLTQAARPAEDGKIKLWIGKDAGYLYRFVLDAEGSLDLTYSRFDGTFLIQAPLNAIPIANQSVSFDSLPKEQQDCAKQALGDQAVQEVFREGRGATSEEAQKLSACNIIVPVQPSPQEQFDRLPPQIQQCLRDSLGEATLNDLLSGKRDPTKDETDKLQKCGLTPPAPPGK